MTVCAFIAFALISYDGRVIDSLVACHRMSQSAQTDRHGLRLSVDLCLSAWHRHTSRRGLTDTAWQATTCCFSSHYFARVLPVAVKFVLPSIIGSMAERCITRDLSPGHASVHPHAHTNSRTPTETHTWLWCGRYWKPVDSAAEVRSLERLDVKLTEGFVPLVSKVVHFG